LRPATLIGMLALLAMLVAAAWQISESPGSIGLGSLKSGGAQTGARVTVSVFEGDSAKQIGERLQDAGAIDSATQFRVLVALMGYDSLLQAGEYEFDHNTPVLEAVQRIRHGQVATRTVTVIEGWRLEEVADAVAKTGLTTADEFKRMAVVANFKEYTFLQDAKPDATLEGYLYPATYSFGTKATAKDIIEMMLTKFGETLTRDLRNQVDQSPYTLPQVLTIASIIEREAKVAEERPTMAQVFLKRLTIRQALEADPTVQYALGSQADSVARFGYWKRELTLADYSFSSPYNTYVNAGLPPGPICSPRIDSIKAVLNPSPTNFLYFVAKPDGSHAFAETYAEHLANVSRYTS